MNDRFKELYGSGLADEELKPSLNLQSIKFRILIAHEESTYRSGEIPLKRWLFPDLAPFFNKGRGRSLMISAFLDLHETEEIFSLDESEWSNAIRYNIII